MEITSVCGGCGKDLLVTGSFTTDMSVKIKVQSCTNCQIKCYDGLQNYIVKLKEDIEKLKRISNNPFYR